MGVCEVNRETYERMRCEVWARAYAVGLQHPGHAGLFADEAVKEFERRVVQLHNPDSWVLQCQ